ncbi:MAG: c-type cytochrome [Nitrospinales bacterium]
MIARRRKIHISVGYSLWSGVFNLIVGIGLLLILSACGSDEEKTDSPTASKPIIENPQPSAVVTPTKEKKILVTQKTKDTYQWYCAQCHGVKGKGNGINSTFLTVPPRDHTKADYLETRTDEQLFNAIKLGGVAVGRAPCMPAWGHTLDEEMISSLVRYIRELCQCEAF